MSPSASNSGRIGSLLLKRVRVPNADVAFGSIFGVADLSPNPDVFAARLAAQFVYGAQLGWFSLGGIDHGPKLDTKCGPMGIGRYKCISIPPTGLLRS